MVFENLDGKGRGKGVPSPPPQRRKGSPSAPKRLVTAFTPKKWAVVETPSECIPEVDHVQAHSHSLRDGTAVAEAVGMRDALARWNLLRAEDLGGSSGIIPDDVKERVVLVWAAAPTSSSSKLYLSERSVAENTHVLEALSVRRVVNMAATQVKYFQDCPSHPFFAGGGEEDCPPPPPSVVKILDRNISRVHHLDAERRLFLCDLQDAPMLHDGNAQADSSWRGDSTFDLRLLDDLTSFIGEGLDAGHNVLVHCAGGVSRSAAAVLGFLIRGPARLRLCESYRYLQMLRPVIAPNHCFLRILDDWEFSCLGSRSLCEGNGESEDAGRVHRRTEPVWVDSEDAGRVRGSIVERRGILERAG